MCMRRLVGAHLTGTWFNPSMDDARLQELSEALLEQCRDSSAPIDLNMLQAAMRELGLDVWTFAYGFRMLHCPVCLAFGWR